LVTDRNVALYENPIWQQWNKIDISTIHTSDAIHSKVFSNTTMQQNHN